MPLSAPSTLHRVRSVSTNKDMFCISFRLPYDLAFAAEYAQKLCFVSVAVLIYYYYNRDQPKETAAQSGKEEEKKEEEGQGADQRKRLRVM